MEKQLQDCVHKRYSNNLPYVDNCVKINGVHINASIVKIYDAQIIATEAPLPNNFVNFWKMVYKYKIKCAVMLTDLTENSQVKAHCYWPTSTFTFDNIKVTHLGTENCTQIVKRMFVLENLKTNDTLHFIHLHYKNWPDYKTPDDQSISVLLDYAKIYGDIVVHCSAGIGRTGTFLALLHLINSLLNGKHSISKNSISNDIINNISSTTEYLKSQRNFVFNQAQLDYIIKYYSKFIKKHYPFD